MSWADSLEDDYPPPEPTVDESDRKEPVTQSDSKDGGFQTRGGHRGGDRREYRGGREDRDRGYGRGGDDRDRGYGRGGEDRDRGYGREGGYRHYNHYDDRRGRGGYSRGGYQDRPREPYVQKPVPDEPPFKIYVKNLAWSLTAKDVGEYFDHLLGGGKVVAVDAPRNDMGQSKGVAIVEFTDREALVDALKANGEELSGREIIVNVELPRRQHDNSFYRGGHSRPPRDNNPPSSEPKEAPAPDAASPSQPSQRPKLTLQPRTVSEPLNQPAVLTKVDPFGGAKPVDTAKVEEEKFQKFQQKIALKDSKDSDKPEGEKDESEPQGEPAPAEKPPAETSSASSPPSTAPASSPAASPWRAKNRGEPSSDSHYPDRRRGRGGDHRGGDHRGGDHRGGDHSFGGRWSGRGGHDSRRGDHRSGDDRRPGGDRRRGGDDRRGGDFKSRGGAHSKPSSVHNSSHSSESKQPTSESVNKFAALEEDTA